MALTPFYIQTTGSDLNAGSTTANTAAYTSTSGDWSTVTHIFTPTDGSTPASTVAANDWVSIYANGATTLVFVAQVTAVAAGVNGGITVSATLFLGVAPTTGTGTRSLKAGGAWASPTPIMNGALGANTILPLDVKVNVKAGTYTRTASETCQLRGSNTVIGWIAGYNTTPGDLDNDTTNALAKPVWSYNATFGLQLNGDFLTFTSISILGNRTGAMLTVQSVGLKVIRVRVENTSSNASAGAFSSSLNATILLYCWFKTPTTATSVAVVALGAATYALGCVAEGGGLAGWLLSGSGQFTIAQCVGKNNTGSGMSITGTSPFLLVSNFTASRPTGDGISLTTISNTAIAIVGCIFSRCGGWGINNSSGNTNIVQRACNDFYLCTSGDETGFGTNPSFFQQDEVSDPLTSSTDLSVVVGALARATGFPGIFENQSYTSYLTSGAVDPQTGSGSGGAIATVFFGG